MILVAQDLNLARPVVWVMGIANDKQRRPLHLVDFKLPVIAAAVTSSKWRLVPVVSAIGFR